MIELLEQTESAARIIAADTELQGAIEHAQYHHKNGNTLFSAAYLAHEFDVRARQFERDLKTHSKEARASRLDGSCKLAHLEHIIKQYVEALGGDVSRAEKGFKNQRRAKAAIIETLKPLYLQEVKSLYNEMVTEKKLPSDVYYQMSLYWPLAQYTPRNIIPDNSDISGYQMSRVISLLQPDEKLEERLREIILTAIKPLLRTEPSTKTPPRQFILDDGKTPDRPDHGQRESRAGGQGR